jgi:hypothetical protein
LTQIDISFLIRVVVGTLGTIILAVVAAMLIGLFRVETDHAQIVAILGPAFQTIIGAFVGAFSTALAFMRTRNGNSSESPAP